jgi:hypothetical protein
MVWFILGHLFTSLLDWMSIGRLSAHEKDLEILLLRQQLTILRRRLHKSIRPARAEKLTLAILAAKFKSMTQHPTIQLGKIIRLFQPETVIEWHRELVTCWLHAASVAELCGGGSRDVSHQVRVEHSPSVIL